MACAIFRCRSARATWSFWGCVTLRFSDSTIEAAYEKSQSSRLVASGFMYSCLFGGILACHSLVDAGELEGQELLTTLQIALPSAMLVFVVYFAVRFSTRNHNMNTVDELLALMSCLLLSVSLALLRPLRLIFQELDDFWLETSVSQILCLLLTLQVPVKSTSAMFLQLASVLIVFQSDGFGWSFALICCVAVFLYLEVRKGEQLRRAAFLSRHQHQDLARHWKQKEAEAKNNMTLARAMQNLAGRRCDLIVILDSELKVWQSTALLDIFFKQDMQDVHFADLLLEDDKGPFLALVQRIREHKAGESLPLAFPRGRANVILEYAGCEDDRFVMSILLDEYADQVYRSNHQDVFIAGLVLKGGVGLPLKSWEPVYKTNSTSDVTAVSQRPSSHFGQASPADDDSLCYSHSEDHTVKSSRKSWEILSDEASTLRLWPPPKVMVDKEVQVAEKDISPKAPSRPALPRPPGVPPRLSRSCSSRSNRSDSCSSSQQAPDNSTLRLTAPSFQLTSKACIFASIGWLLQHWNFAYKRVQCCPMHSALAVAKALLKSHAKERCNPLWSCFMGWQCVFCTAMNHETAKCCDLCGTCRPAEALAAESNTCSTSMAPTEGSGDEHRPIQL
ncbi:unnamed protein product [Effrenium voratum]|nr:unnamed protein product [Effrenium voratum]